MRADFEGSCCVDNRPQMGQLGIGRLLGGGGGGVSLQLVK